MLGLFLLAEPACGPDLEVQEGEHVRYQSDASFHVCQGTYARVDEFVAFVVGETGVAMPGLQDYRWLDNRDFGRANCPKGTDGCAHDGIAVSLEPFLLHELVHSVMFTLGYPYQPFFDEGLAVALDPWSGDELGPRYVPQVATAEVWEDPRPSMTMAAEDLNYLLAGSFVSFLLARHGSGDFLEFTRELAGSRDMRVIEEAFGSAFDVSLDVEAELFIAGAPCTLQGHGPSVFDCTSPEVPWDGDEWSLSGVMDCDSDMIAGGFGPEHSWPSLRSVTLEVPVSGRYRLRLADDGEVGVQLGPCSSCPWEGGGGIVRSEEPLSLDLVAGTHFVRIQAQSDESPSFRVMLSPEKNEGPEP